MAIALNGNSAIISTAEYSLPNNSVTLTPQTDIVVLNPMLYLGNMIALDQYEFKYYDKVYSAAAPQALIWTRVYFGVQAEPNIPLPSMVVGYGWDLTCKKLAGTDRLIGWRLGKVS